MTPETEIALVLAIGTGDEASLEVYADALEGLWAHASILRGMLSAKRTLEALAAAFSQIKQSHANNPHEFSLWLKPLGWYGSAAQRLFVGDDGARFLPFTPWCVSVDGWREARPNPVGFDSTWLYCGQRTDPTNSLSAPCLLHSGHAGPHDRNFRIEHICARTEGR